MPEEHNPEQDEGIEGRFLRERASLRTARRRTSRGTGCHCTPRKPDDDEVEAHSMGRLSLPEDPNTRF